MSRFLTGRDVGTSGRIDALCRTNDLVEFKDLISDRDGEQMRRCLRSLKELFETHFDQNWFILLLEDLPIDPNAMAELRELMSHESSLVFDPYEVYERLPILEKFIDGLYHYLLPYLREKLEISGFVQNRRYRDKGQILLRKFVAYTFPVNLGEFARAARRLKRLFPSY
jgi:hypothetical protein